MRELALGILYVLCFTVNGLVFIDTFAPSVQRQTDGRDHTRAFEVPSAVAVAVCALMSVVWLSDVADEVGGCLDSGGLRAHLKSIWNMLDVGTLLLTGGVLGAQFVAFAGQTDGGATSTNSSNHSLQPSNLTSSASSHVELSMTGLAGFDTMRYLQALAYPLVFARPLYFFQGFESSGVLVRMIIGIV